MRASYDTNAMRGCAQELESTTSSLQALTRQLHDVVPGALPVTVDSALDHFVQQGRTMISKVSDETAALSNGLRRAAQAYDDLDASVCRTFGAG